jgi:FkbM family methyltransferase
LLLLNADDGSRIVLRMFDELLIALGRIWHKPRGWERVVRWFAPPGPTVQATPRIVERADGFKFLAEPTSLIGWHVLYFGVYDYENERLLRSLLRPGGVVLDVGANVGWDTLTMASLVGPSGRVVAFEPNPNVRDRLVANIARNSLAQVTVLPLALADRAGSVHFHTPLATEVGAGDGHIASTSDGADQSDYMIEVKTETLDRLWPELHLDRLDLMMVDAEGWDWNVLKGAEATLAKYRPHVLFEYDESFNPRGGGSQQKFEELFVALDYNLERIERGGPVPLTAHWPAATNILATPRPR